jgi:hypothetical protein
MAGGVFMPPRVRRPRPECLTGSNPTRDIVRQSAGHAEREERLREITAVTDDADVLHPPHLSLAERFATQRDAGL